MAFLGPFDLSALSSAFTSLGLHSDCSVAAMFSPRLCASLWLPSIGAGNAFDKSAKFEDLRVPEVLVALIGGSSSKDDTVSPPRDPSPCFESKMLTFGFGAVSGTSLSIFFKMVCLGATLVAILREAHCDLVAGQYVSCGMMGLVTLLFLAGLCHELLHLDCLVAGKGYVRKEDRKESVRAQILVISLLTTGLSTIAGGTAAAKCAALVKSYMVAAAACGSAFGLVKSLNYGIQVFAEFFVSGTVAGVVKIGKTWTDGDGAMLLAKILTLGSELTLSFSFIASGVLHSTYLGITTLSQGQFDLHRGGGRPREKSLPQMQQPHAVAAYQVTGDVPGHLETEHEVHQGKGSSRESATFQDLVKQLSGQHLAVSVKSDWLNLHSVSISAPWCLWKLSTWSRQGGISIPPKLCGKSS